MNCELRAPSASLQAYFNELEATVNNDLSGEKTLRLIDYLKEVEFESREWQLKITDFQERHFIGSLIEAFKAAKRILVHQWQLTHGKELAS